MIRSRNFKKVLTSELLINQETVSEQQMCRSELYRRLKSISFTDEQIEKFITSEQAIISRKSYSADENLMAQTEFFNSFYARKNLKIEKLTISELLLATEQATNVYPCASAREEQYFNLVFDYARQGGAIGYHAAINNLQNIGLEEDSIKKFIFAELQVIRRVTFDDQEAIDAWGKPEKFLS